MTPYAVQTFGLTKRYRGAQVLGPLDLSLPMGGIYGLIGENGAGKTTLIRLITGLARPSRGSLALFGKTGRELPRQRSRIGYCPSCCALYPDLTALENLEVRRIEWGIPGRSCLESALRQTGLQGDDKKKVRSYSTGMKQRLSLACALLGQPELLILDEPLNGLDPTGIIELRELLAELNRERGITILISSHILPELDRLATCFGFLHRGRLLQSISSAELNARCRRHLLLRTPDPGRAAAALETELHTVRYEAGPEGSLRIYDYLDAPQAVSSVLMRCGVPLMELSCEGDTLETYYTRLIGGDAP